VLEATGEAVLMSDADLSTPIQEVEKLLPWLVQGFDVVIASRDMPDSVLDPPQPWRRRTLAKVFRALRQRLMLPDIRDTQCGFKLFRRAAAQRVFSQETEPGWAFDCEVLGLARLMGCRIKEVGVLWRNDPDTRVRTIPDGWRMLVSLCRIARKLRRLAAASGGPRQ
jgi:dolichyl-phosphate beta-glucosyltransferase